MSEPNLRDDDPEIMSDDPFVRETDDEMKQAREEEAAYDRARYITLSRPVPSKPLTPTERLVAFADRIEAGESPSEAAGLEWEMLVADIRSLDATQAVEPGLREAAEHAAYLWRQHAEESEEWAAINRLDKALAARSSSAPAELREALEPAVRYGYQRGHADAEYRRGYREDLAAQNWRTEWDEKAVLALDAAARLTSSPENPA